MHLWFYVFKANTISKEKGLDLKKALLKNLFM